MNDEQEGIKINSFCSAKIATIPGEQNAKGSNENVNRAIDMLLAQCPPIDWNLHDLRITIIPKDVQS